MRNPIITAVTATMAAGPALAAPAVVSDIPPVHSLVARVMEGVGKPGLILPPGASPHGYAMRPSEAGMLSEAEVVFWVGEGLTPWLERSLESLAGDAVSVELLEVDGVELLETRSEASFGHGTHDGHEDEHDHGDEHDHDDQHVDDEAKADDHDHEDEHAHDEAKDDNHDHEDEHAEADGHDHDHDHGFYDPHAWLDPENAKVWLGAIAAALSKADSGNADLYAANAAAGRDEIDELQARIDERLESVRGRPFVVLHDAYHYFEHRFDVEAAGSLSISDASDPGPARVAEIRDLVGSLGTVCVFAEPQFEGRPIGIITEGAEVRTGILDPLGVDLEPGPGLYPALLGTLADGLAECLQEG